MSEEKDLLGIRPFGEATKSIVDSTLSGVGRFLSAVCLPACEELGRMLQDGIRSWRLNNIIRVLEKSEGKLEFRDNQFQLKANPKVALSIIENASLVDDDTLQEWWAGLFASSCTEDGKDDQNLIFVNLLKDLTAFEVKVLSYCCFNCKKYIYPNKLIYTNHDFRVSLEEIMSLTGVTDVRRIDRELDHMISLGLFSNGLINVSGFIVDDEEMVAHLTPSALALNLYYKANTITLTPEEFWGDSLEPYSEETQIQEASH